LAALMTGSDEVGRGTGNIKLLTESAILASQAGHLARARYDRDQFLVIERLGDVVECTLTHGGDRTADTRIAGQHHDRNVRAMAAGFAQQVGTIGAVAR